jgi:tetratricopeptide (TPR) repeat protein
MRNKDIDSIAYLLKRAKETNQPKPIVFLGAGASISAGIPGSIQIIKDILKTFKDKPEIKKLSVEERTYYNLMGCLNTEERHQLLRDYISNKDVKINVTHIYLAQMLKEGYVDYVLTVNFDDLFLRACALFNFIPPVYDISILKDFTTTNLTEKSVTYLHGQHHGFWLLNTDEELEKVKEYIPTVFDRICNKRTWIVVGYSGEDPIFDQIARLGHFTNELFWVGYNENLPNENVQEKLINKPNSNASFVSGYDADSFFLKLHSELKLDTPDIFNKPFSFLKDLMGNIKDIDEGNNEGKHQLLFKNIKERYDVALKQTADAIKLYEKKGASGELSPKEIIKGQLKQEIIESIVKEKFSNANRLYKQADKNDEEIRNLLSQLYSNWAAHLLNAANNLRVERKAIEKCKMAIKLNPQNSAAFNNWGNALFSLATYEKSVSLYREAIEKYIQSTDINPKNSLALNNWAATLINLAKEANENLLLKEAIDKCNRAIDINPDCMAYNNWSAALINLGSEEKDIKEAKLLYTQAIEKCREAFKLEDKNLKTLTNWGIALFALGKIDKDTNSLNDAIEKHYKRLEINPKCGGAYLSIANILAFKAKIGPEIESRDTLLIAKDNASKAISFGESAYDLSCCYALLNDKENALKTLNEVLKVKSISINYVLNDEDWKGYKNDDDFKILINKYSESYSMVI